MKSAQYVSVKSMHLNEDLNKPIFGKFSKLGMKKPVDAYTNPLILNGRNTVGSINQFSNNEDLNLTETKGNNLSKSLNQKRSLKKPQSGYHRSRNNQLQNPRTVIQSYNSKNGVSPSFDKLINGHMRKTQFVDMQKQNKIHVNIVDEGAPKYTGRIIQGSHSSLIPGKNQRSDSKFDSIKSNQRIQSK